MVAGSEKVQGEELQRFYVFHFGNPSPEGGTGAGARLSIHRVTACSSRIRNRNRDDETWDMFVKKLRARARNRESLKWLVRARYKGHKA